MDHWFRFLIRPEATILAMHANIRGDQAMRFAWLAWDAHPDTWDF